ncbi:MAG: multidrug effflux MFS transporter [Pseudomonadota bacterium]
MNRSIFFLAFLTGIPALSTDMYLPALPFLRAEWNQPVVMINMTLVAFFLSYCVFLLVFGPVSDQVGRRPPLLVGLTIYIIGGIFCAVSNRAEMMICARVLQGAGAASTASLSMAICRDVFETDQRERALAHISVIMALAPMIAPIIGGWVMTLISWRGVFVIQTALGALALLGVAGMKESLQVFTKTKPSQVLNGYFRLFRNLRFTGLTLAAALSALPLFGFIAGSSEIYISNFGVDEKEFGYYFALNAAALMAGSITFSRLRGRIRSDRLMFTGFVGLLAFGLLIVLFPYRGPAALALPMMCVSFSLGLSRPPCTSLILAQVERDAGAASSMIAFSFMIIGSMSMSFISLDWTDKVTVLGLMAAAAGLVASSFWLAARKKYIPAGR